MKFWSTPELLTTPAPLKIKRFSAESLNSWITVNASAPGAKTMLSTSVAVGISIKVCDDVVNVAISDGPSGIVAGVQLAAVSQSELVGFALHVALPASTISVVQKKQIADTKENLFILPLYR